MAETAPADDRGFPQAEPPSGSVVAIDWSEHHQEVWVSDRSNIGNWYTLDVRLDFARDHPTWYDVLRRAEGRALALLVPAAADAYAAGFDAGVARVGEAVSAAIDEACPSGLARHRSSPRSIGSVTERLQGGRGLLDGYTQIRRCSGGSGWCAG